MFKENLKRNLGKIMTKIYCSGKKYQQQSPQQQQQQYSNRKKEKNRLLLKKKILMNQFPRITEPPKSGIETIQRKTATNLKAGVA